MCTINRWKYYLLFFFLTPCTIGYSQAVEIRTVSAFMDSPLERIEDPARRTYIARLYIEIEGDTSLIKSIEVKLDKLSKDFRTSAVVVDRKLDFNLSQELPRGFSIQKTESAIFLSLGEFTEPELFDAKVVIEDINGKKSKAAIYKSFKN